MTFREYLDGMRVPTLSLSVATVWIGIEAARRVLDSRAASRVMQPACAAFAGDSHCMPSAARSITLALLCLAVAVFLQIAVNFANDYSDGIRGTDVGRTTAAQHADLDAALDETATPEEIRMTRERTGPERLVASGIPMCQVLAAAIANAVLACACGLTIVLITGYWWLVLVGLVCVAAAWFYVGGAHPYGYMGFGELAAFVFFGPVAALGTQFVISGTCTLYGLYGAVAIGAVSAAIMAVNNLRDIRTDKQAGKRTLAVRLGARAFTVCVCALLASIILAMVVPWSVLWAGMESHLPNLTIIGGYCAVVGEIVLILLGAVTEINIAKHEYRSAMKHLSWIALAVALVYFGMSSSL